MKQKLGGSICLWGGVNGFVTMETGTPTQVKEELRNALGTLAPGVGFMLSLVDNVTENRNRAWRNIRALIGEWRKGRGYPMGG